MTGAETLAKNLTQSGYGAEYPELLKILNKLTYEDIDTLTYSCYRAAEKCGLDVFDCQVLYKEEPE